jgi:capsular polysaccharide biosynthesis protein
VDFVTMAQVLWRRIYVFVPLVLVVAALTVVYGHSIKPTYQYSESLLLLGPSAPSSSSDQPTVPFNNPWFQFDKSLVPVETLVINAMYSPGVDTGVPKGSGVTAAFGAGSDPSIPVIRVSTSSKNRTAAEAALQPAVEAFKTNLRTWQKQTGATDNALVTTLATPGGIGLSVLYPGKTRGEAAIFAVGLIISLILTFVAEAVLVRRRTRSMSSGGPANPANPGTAAIAGQPSDVTPAWRPRRTSVPTR